MHRFSDYLLALTQLASARGLTGIGDTQRIDGTADGWNSR